MSPRLFAPEPAFGPYAPMRAEELLGGARLVGVDGHGGSGKSTLAAVLAATVPGAVVVHCDDLCWHAPMFGWSRMLLDELLAPLAEGRAVELTPPDWPRHGRSGSISVPADAPLVVVEGTGSCPRGAETLYQRSLWVQADRDEAERRGLERDVAQATNGDAAQARAFWDEWMAHEVVWFAEQRPWERADLVVDGDAAAPTAQRVMACAPGRAPGRERAGLTS